MVVLSWKLYTMAHHNAESPSQRPVLAALQLAPPQPYHYDTFMAWLRRTNFSEVPGVGWPPEVAEFDLDAAAAAGKYAPYLAGSEGAAAVAAAKGINKFVFMREIIASGDITTTGAPGTHLYILRRMLGAARGGSPHPTFLDAGCGTGYLLLAWRLLAGEGSRAIGFDVSKDVVDEARRHLQSSNVLDPLVALHSGSTNLFVGDVFRPNSAAWGLQEGSVDAINVGVAVRAVSDLNPLARLLRQDGVLIAPICWPDAKQPADVPVGRCAGFLRVLRKGRSNDDIVTGSSLVQDPRDPNIEVRFIVAGPASVPALRR